jgi:hypothetical protein
MRHVFWNRFPYYPRFFLHVLSGSEKEEQYVCIMTELGDENWTARCGILKSN